MWIPNNKKKRICASPLSSHRKSYSKYLMQFLEGHIADINPNMLIADIGCGRKRNSEFLYQLGFNNIHCFDMVQHPSKIDPFIQFYKCDLEESIPMDNNQYDIILCNFVYMFLRIENRKNFAAEITRIARANAFLIFEVNTTQYIRYGIEYNFEETVEIFKNNGWDIIHKRKDRFVGRRKIVE